MLSMLQGGEKKMFMPSLRGLNAINNYFLETEAVIPSHDNINHVFFFTCFVYYYLGTVLSVGE